MDKELEEMIRDKLQTLHNSCREWEYGYWDANPSGFAAMVENLEEVALLLGIQLKELYTGVETND